MQPITPELSAEQRKVLTDIAEYGCHVVSVPEDGETPDYSFTVGLWHTWQHPEIAVVGLDEQVAQDLLNAVADMIDEGTTFTVGQVAQGLIDTYPVTFKAIPEGHVAGYFGTAAWANEGVFPVLQLVYPDKLGRYPWHEGCAQGFRELQPLIADLPPTPETSAEAAADADAAP